MISKKIPKMHGQRRKLHTTEAIGSMNLAVKNPPFLTPSWKEIILNLLTQIDSMQNFGLYAHGGLSREDIILARVPYIMMKGLGKSQGRTSRYFLTHTRTHTYGHRWTPRRPETPFVGDFENFWCCVVGCWAFDFSASLIIF
jgi:hypothetical protein